MSLVSFKYDINHDILTDAQGWDNASWPMQWKDETVIGSSMSSQKRLRHHYNNWCNTTDAPKVGGSKYGQYALILYYSIATPCVSKLKNVASSSHLQLRDILRIPVGTFSLREKKQVPVPEKGSRWVRTKRKMRRRYEDPNIVGTIGWKGPPKYIDNLYIWPGVNTFIGVSLIILENSPYEFIQVFEK